MSLSQKRSTRRSAFVIRLFGTLSQAALAWFYARTCALAVEGSFTFFKCGELMLLGTPFTCVFAAIGFAAFLISLAVHAKHDWRHYRFWSGWLSKKASKAVKAARSFLL